MNASGRASARHVVVPGGLISPGFVEWEYGRITALGPWSGAVDHEVLAPGFIDLQVNGVDDLDVAAVRSATDWARLCSLVHAQGTTTWLPTLVTAPLAAYPARLASVADAMAAETSIAGIHLEGPFLGGAPGAHRRDWVVDVDMPFLAGLPSCVRLMTLAPEARGAGAAVRALAARGVVVSLGHSAADDMTTLAALDAGARMATHLFNGMGPLHHRSPGLAAVALTDERVVCGLIADGIHVHPRMLTLAARVLGPVGRLALVTDSVAWRAGHVGDLGIALVDGVPRLPDGTLAGSAVTMDRALGTMVRRAGMALADAVAAASTTPARLMGWADRGSLSVGLRADLCALDERLICRATWLAGDRVH